jgi:hypothetical protein
MTDKTPLPEVVAKLRGATVNEYSSLIAMLWRGSNAAWFMYRRMFRRCSNEVDNRLLAQSAGRAPAESLFRAFLMKLPR